MWESQNVSPAWASSFRCQLKSNGKIAQEQEDITCVIPAQKPSLTSSSSSESLDHVEHHDSSLKECSTTTIEVAVAEKQEILSVHKEIGEKKYKHLSAREECMLSTGG